MFDTMTLTKIVGALCGALLIYLMSGWAAETLYATGGGGHGDGHGQAYVIDTGEDDQGSAEVEEGPSLAEMMASAEVAKGEKVFGKCKACHKVEDGANSTGPFLYGVVGRDVGTAGGFTSYSGALNEVVDVWTPETLNAFLESPKGYAPGTSMAFSGLKKPMDRANLIMYLDQLDGDVFPMEMPAEAEEEAAAEPVAEETHDEAAAEEAVEEVATEEVAAVETEEPVAEAAAEETAGSDFAAMVAAGDVAKGEKLFKRCMACHKAEDGAKGVGPHLYGVVGRAVASVDGYKYSDAVKALGGDWTVDRLNEWLTNPKAYAEGNKMRFKGVKEVQDRADIVAFLDSVDN